MDVEGKHLPPSYKLQVAKKGSLSGASLPAKEADLYLTSQHVARLTAELRTGL
jgi:hypothetical protein